MANRIDRIKLRSCRGATTTTEIQFEANKPLVLIFGENGSGKSTIVDAIDMVCNGRCGSLDGRSSANQRSHVASIGQKPGDVFVELSVGGQSWHARMAGGKILTDGPEPFPVSHILRRAQLLRLVEAPPSERYAGLADFIDAITPIESCEQTLADAVKSAKVRADTATEDRNSAESALDELWTAEGGSDKNAIDWAANRASADPRTLELTSKQLADLIQKLDRAIESQAKAIEAHKQKRSASQVLSGINDEIAAMTGLSAGESIQLVRVLQTARDYAERIPVDGNACPVCEQSVEFEELRTKLDNRLTAMEAYRLLSNRVSDAEQSLEVANALAETERRRFVQGACTLASSAFEGDFAQYLSPELSRDAYTRLLDESQNIAKETLDQARTLISELTAQRTSLDRTRESAQRNTSQLNAIRQLYSRVKKTTQTIKSSTEVLTKLNAALDIVRTERLVHAQTILDSVGSECERLYGKIHPGEKLGLDRLRLDENKRASLHQDANFEGEKGVPPQAYFSESHLDTLGFCFWLAVAKLSTGDQAIIVLDDVFTSVDSVHIRRIIDLLMDECENFRQVIITTHYRTWRDIHRYQQAAASKSQLIELSRWKRSYGIRHHRSKLAIEELREKLNAVPLDRQALAAAAGVLLEQTLDHLTLLYRCSLRRSQDGEHALGELLDAVKRLSKQLKLIRKRRDSKGHLVQPVGEETISVESTVQSLSSMSFIRNEVGCHFNAAGADISDADVEDFAGKTLELASMFVCPTCAEVARRKKGTHYACSCNELRMEPLELL